MTDGPDRAEVGLESLVARVNSRSQLVLNVGTQAGVKPGDIFQILPKDGIPINDPETGELLGVIPVEKARVKAQTVYPKICIVETYRTYTVGGGVGSMSTIFGPEREVREQMEVDASAEYDVDKTVRVGDIATLISLAK
ncbi:MAG: hypothetical protein ACRDTN_13060 [Mycobacterium sp.]